MSTRTICYDWDGNPITVEQWMAMHVPEKIHVADTLLRKGRRGRQARVSTVWLGVNYGLGSPDRPPIIFETMIFGGRMDGFVARYTTKEQAREGHRQVVEAARYVLQRPPLIRNGGKP